MDIMRNFLFFYSIKMSDYIQGYSRIYCSIVALGPVIYHTEEHCVCIKILKLKIIMLHALVL